LIIALGRDYLANKDLYDKTWWDLKHYESLQGYPASFNPEGSPINTPYAGRPKGAPMAPNMAMVTGDEGPAKGKLTGVQEIEARNFAARIMPALERNLQTYSAHAWTIDAEPYLAGGKRLTPAMILNSTPENIQKYTTQQQWRTQPIVPTAGWWIKLVEEMNQNDGKSGVLLDVMKRLGIDTTNDAHVLDFLRTQEKLLRAP
jgi:hypothetical protein